MEFVLDPEFEDILESLGSFNIGPLGFLDGDPLIP